MSSVDAEEIERFSRIAEQWWDSEGKFKPLHRINPLRIEYIRLQACRHFGLSSADSAPLTGLRVLDIGCGGGLVCEPLRRLGAQVTGIDAAEKNIKVAALHAEKSGLDIDYRATTAEALLETGAQYDMVLALEVVEHVADVPAFVETCTRLVKPGGLMVWATLNRTPQSFAMAIVGAEYVLRWLPVGTHSWKKFLKPSELGGALRRCGMTVTHLTGMVMQPLSGKWRLDSGNLSVNYLLTAQKT